MAADRERSSPAQGASGRLVRALAAIDTANQDDPATITVDGVSRPKERTHAELMTSWLARLDPDASEAQRLAARAHHLRRWATPRGDYPDGRSGYLRWRKAANRRHADDVGEILHDCGYTTDVIERVQRIIRKEDLGADPAAQTHEDALCLVFLQTQLEELASRLDESKISDVLRKSVTKMSSRGRAEARELELDDKMRALLIAAVEDVDG